jgi:chemotaxis protein MotB
MSNEFDTVELVPRRRSRAGIIGWLLLLLLVGLAVAFGKYIYLPLRADKVRADGQVAEGLGREKQLKKKIADAETQAGELAAKGHELSGKLAETQAEKDKVEAELKRVQTELSSILEPQISAGNVRIKRRGNELVVDVSDQILFDSGRAEMNESGQKVLAQVAPSLNGLKTYSIQVGGHTDGTRIANPETQERFPTNWELSTARATNVVRFLEERGKIQGARLVATGFAQFRPVAGNATAEDRQRNRRIELVLLPTAAN